MSGGILAAMPRILLVRRLALAGAGLTFGSIAVGALVAPQLVARAYAITPNGVDGMNQLRAIFVGFWLALAFALLTAARRPDATLLGDICGLMILLQALARLLSFALDGIPSAMFVAATLAELANAALILAPRLLASRSVARAP